MAKKITVDDDLCIGCGTCASICPDHFEINDKGKSQVIKPYDEKGSSEIEEAKDSCPVGAIEIVEE